MWVTTQVTYRINTRADGVCKLESSRQIVIAGIINRLLIKRVISV